MEVIFLNTLIKNLGYIWDYYKLYLIGVPLALLSLSYVVTVFADSKELPFSVYFINQELSLEACSSLEEELTRELGETYVDSSLILNPDAPDADSQIAFTTAISGHTIDIMISDTRFLEYYAKKEALADLKDTLPADLYDALTPYLVLAENKEGIMTPYAIDLSSCSYFSDLNLLEPVLTIAKYSEHKNSCIAFLRLLFSL